MPGAKAVVHWSLSRYLEDRLVRVAAFLKSSHYVIASWDGEAQVWYVRATSVPGLSLEAKSPAELLKKIEVAVPELLALNAKSRANHRKQAIPLRYVFEEQLRTA